MLAPDDAEPVLHSRFSKSIAVLVVMTTLAAAPAIASTTDMSMLWRDPGDIAALDFAAGPGASPPAPPYRFVNESVAGSTPKIHVVDVNGVAWMMKFGRITDAQLHDALASSGATPADTSCFTKALRERIRALQSLH